MIPWETVDPPRPGAPDGALGLHRRGDEWSIRSDGVELMNSRRFGSERALAEHAAAALAGRESRRVLVGGLGMGHTLAAALTAFPDAAVVVAELSPRVVAWNRGPLAELAGRPLGDPRVSVRVRDVGEVVREASGAPAKAGAGVGAVDARFDAILLDVDNGPEALSQPGNAALYDARGLALTRAALTPGGVAAWWSAGPSAAFERRLRAAGFRVDTHDVSPRAGGRGRARHRIFLGRAGP